LPNSVALVPLAEFAAAGGKVELPEGAQRVAVTATAEETDEQILSLKGSDAVMMLLDVKPNLRVQVRGLGGSVGVTNAWEWGSVLCVLCVGWREMGAGRSVVHRGSRLTRACPKKNHGTGKPPSRVGRRASMRACDGVMLEAACC